MMKAIMKLSAIALSATALLASCNKVEETAAPETASAGPRTFTCVFAQPDDTKVAIESTGKATWEVGDQILVHGAGSSNKVIVTLTAEDISNDGLNATITVDGVEPYDRTGDSSPIYSTYYAQYPASAAGSGNFYYEARFSKTNDFLMAACNVEDTFVFYNLCGILSYKVQGEFDKVVFSGNNDEAVAYDVYQARVRDDKEHGGVYCNYWKPGNGSGDPVPSTSLEADVNADGSTVNYLCFPNGANFTNGFTFKFYKNDELVKIAVSSAPVDVAHGKLLNLGDISSHLEDYVPPVISDHKSEIPVDGAVNLAASEPANCYIISAPGIYKLPAIKGNSEEEAGAVFGVDLLWETCNSTEAVSANSVIEAVDFEDNWIYFKTPDTLKPGNALIAAMDPTGRIIWSWHIWIPATAITADTFGVSTKKIMSRNLGALVDTEIPAEGIVDVRSLGLYYQWGRKDPFVGYKFGKSAVEIAVSGAAGRGMSKIEEQTTVGATIAAPTTFVAFKGNWLSENNAQLWGNGGDKSMYDPCPAGYRVPAYASNDPLWKQVSGLDGFSADVDAHWWKLGTAVFAFTGCIDYDGGVSHPYDRFWLWNSKENGNPDYGEAQYVYDNSGAWASEPGWGKRKACAAPVRCVKELDVDPIPAPDVEFAIDGDFAEWAGVEAISGTGAVKTMKVGSDAEKMYLYFEVYTASLAADEALAYTNYLTLCCDNGDGAGEKSVSYWNAAQYDKYYQIWMTTNGVYKLNNWSLSGWTRKAAVDGDIVKYECCFDRANHAAFSGKVCKLGVYVDGQTVDTTSGSEVWGGSADPIGFAPASDTDLPLIALKK